MTTDFNWSCHTASSAILASEIWSSAISLVDIVLFAIIALVTVPVSPVVTNVPEIFGIKIYLSAVGFTTVINVSKSSAELPSKTIVELKTGEASNTKTLSDLNDLILG